MKPKHKVAIVRALIALFGVLFGASVTAYTKHQLDGAKPATEQPRPTPKKVHYRIEVSREVEE